MPRIRCISLWQPWASLVACGAKSTETRSRPVPRTILGTRIGIHAAKTRQGMTLAMADRDLWNTLRDYRFCDGLPFGAIIATAYVEASVPTERLKADPFGDFSAGRFGWLFADIQPLAEPIPWKGKQGIFFADLPDL